MHLRPERQEKVAPCLAKLENKQRALSLPSETGRQRNTGHSEDTSIWRHCDSSSRIISSFRLCR